MNIEKIRSIIEALIFASEEPVSLDTLSRAVEEIDKQEVQVIVESLVSDWRSSGRAFHIVEVAGGWQFRTKAEFGPWLQRAHQDRPTKLSRASLETLSVIAYKQPITRPDIEDLRGVDSGAVLKNLLERNLIKVVGKKDAPGKPVVYGTTQRFLEVFSLRDLGSLPSLRDMADLEDDAGQLSFAEVQGKDGQEQLPAPEPEKISDGERRRRIRESVRGLLAGPDELEDELPPPPDEEEDDALQELEQALEKRREAAERAEAVFDDSERDYIEKITHPNMPDEELDHAEGGEVGLRRDPEHAIDQGRSESTVDSDDPEEPGNDKADPEEPGNDKADPDELDGADRYETMGDDDTTDTGDFDDSSGDDGSGDFADEIDDSDDEDVYDSAGQSDDESIDESVEYADSGSEEAPEDDFEDDQGLGTDDAPEPEKT